MKKIILVVAVFAMSASAAFSQFSFGVKGGLNLANVSNSEADTKPGFYAGAFGEYQVSDFFGVAGELLYSIQGAQDKIDGVKVKQHMNYLNVPVLAKFYIADGLSLDVGPQFGFLMSAKTKGKEGGVSIDVDTKDEFKSTDVSAGIGLTYNIGRVMLQGRYNLGLTDTAKDNDGDDKFKNNVIQLGVGFRF